MTEWVIGASAGIIAPDHQTAFEARDGLPFAHGYEYFELRAQLPVVDAALVK